jgi:hypothetical protein
MAHHCPICERFQMRAKEKHETAKIELVQDISFGILFLVLIFTLIFMEN